MMEEIGALLPIKRFRDVIASRQLDCREPVGSVS
jgi:hypothetical protein